MQNAAKTEETSVRRDVESSAGGRAKVNPSFYLRIKELAENDRLLRGIRIEVEHLEKTVRGGSEMVNILFRVPRNVTQVCDPKSGRVEVSSAGARYTYTFAARRSLEANLRDFREFYRRRSTAAEPQPSARKAASARV
jgi:hypothetical protein